MAQNTNGFGTRLVLSMQCAVLMTIAGCSDGRPERVQASGQVLIDGVPLTSGNVKFISQNSRPAMGKLDEKGRFTLSCYAKNDGIVPGIHRVQVNATEEISDFEIKWLAPPKYSRYQTSGISKEILEPTDSLEINLTWDGKKPFVQRLR